MSSDLLNRTADVLEKVAAYLDAEEQQRTAHVQEERTRATVALRDKLAAANVDVPDDVLAKVAQDQEIASMLEKLAAQRQDDAPPDSLGEASDMDENNRGVRTRQEMKKEASSQADDRFLSWINS